MGNFYDIPILETFQRRVVACLVVVLAITSIRVQAAGAASIVRDDLHVETDILAQHDTEDRGIIVPKSLNSALPVAGDSPIARVAHATITAYASVPWQTDDTPFITADGSHVRDGIVAANWLKFGTKIRIPQLSGDKVYEVHDRMHPRFSDRVDVWVESTAKARQIGRRQNYRIEVLR